LKDPKYANTEGSEITAEEIAVPPSGEIQKLYLREVNGLRAKMATGLATLPAGLDGQGSPWYPKFQAFKTALDAVAASRSQASCFALIPHMLETVKAKVAADGTPEFFVHRANWMESVCQTIYHAIARHIIDQNAVVSPENLTKFITVFSNREFYPEGELGEDYECPVDARALIILDAASAVAQLKAQPWQNAERFLGSGTATEAFARYEEAGDGLAALKAKYVANKAAIIAKWDELAAWVAQQRQAQGNP
jgi:hypothetical protein